jgi:hypothetical protein
VPIIVRLFRAFLRKRDRFIFKGQPILALSYPSLFSTVQGSMPYARNQLNLCKRDQRRPTGCGGERQLNETVLPLMNEVSSDLRNDARLYPTTPNGVLRAIGPRPPYRFPSAGHLRYAIGRFETVLHLARTLHRAVGCSAYLGF